MWNSGNPRKIGDAAFSSLLGAGAPVRAWWPVLIDPRCEPADGELAIVVGAPGYDTWSRVVSLQDVLENGVGVMLLKSREDCLLRILDADSGLPLKGVDLVAVPLRKGLGILRRVYTMEGASRPETYSTCSGDDGLAEFVDLPSGALALCLINGSSYDVPWQDSRDPIIPQNACFRVDELPVGCLFLQVVGERERARSITDPIEVHLQRLAELLVEVRLDDGQKVREVEYSIMPTEETLRAIDARRRGATGAAATKWAKVLKDLALNSGKLIGQKGGSIAVRLPAEGNYQILVGAPGYVMAELEISIGLGERLERTVKLISDPWVAVRLLNETGEPLSFAVLRWAEGSPVAHMQDLGHAIQLRDMFLRMPARLRDRERIQRARGGRGTCDSEGYIALPRSWIAGEGVVVWHPETDLWYFQIPTVHEEADLGDAKSFRQSAIDIKPPASQGPVMRGIVEGVKSGDEGDLVVVATPQPVAYPGVLTVLGARGAFSANIDEDGSFSFGWLPAGRYSFTVSRRVLGTTTTIENAKVESVDVGPGGSKLLRLTVR